MKLPKKKKNNQDDTGIRFYRSKFQKTFHGCSVTRSDGVTEIYYFGIIDILVQYVSKKKVEHLLRAIAYSAEDVSVTNPQAYSTRFFEFINRLIDTPEEEEE